MTSKWARSLVAAFVAVCASAEFVSGQSVTRAESLKIAETFIQHRWHASAKNVRHGKDSDGIEIHTPDRGNGRGSPPSECWVPDAENIGVAYKWGGNDGPKSFTAGIRAGKAAGDVYTLEKRRLGDKAVSGDAVGIDCSGFINHCWKLATRHSTNSFASICQKLPSPGALEPADIMNTANGHVLLFVKWLDAEKRRALFYEAAPFSKTLASERDVQKMAAAGYTPLRYRRIRN
ncbi:MAG TPA: hypothetical protein VEX43_02270 [Chthoniobacterales bacterium]|nr:hypothetical protein [Chthoniobacterales bacterium]